MELEEKSSVVEYTVYMTDVEDGKEIVDSFFKGKKA